MCQRLAGYHRQRLPQVPAVNQPQYTGRLVTRHRPRNHIGEHRTLIGIPRVKGLLGDSGGPRNRLHAGPVVAVLQEGGYRCFTQLLVETRHFGLSGPSRSPVLRGQAERLAQSGSKAAAPVIHGRRAYIAASASVVSVIDPFAGGRFDTLPRCLGPASR
jgi:hypothetical protein